VESPRLNRGELTPEAPELLVSAFQTVNSSAWASRDSVGLLGLSVGGSLALMAGADPRISRQVRLIEAVGGYDRLLSLSRAVITESSEDESHRGWVPAPLARDAVRANLIALAPAQDSAALSSALSESPAPESGLSPDGLYILALLRATSPSAFDSAAAALPDNLDARLNALSPAGVLRAIRAPVYLMVDRGDSYVPPQESDAIAAALRQQGHLVYYSRFDILRHVEPGSSASPVTLARDLLRMFLHICSLIGRL
jgi:pimeloyl-ACP methyl ester carboxylesterase